MLQNLSENNRAATFMVLAMLGYLLNDTMMKLVGEDISLFQSVAIRGLAMLAIVIALVFRSGHSFNLLNYRNVILLLRIVVEIGLTLFFLLALFHIPIANLTAIIQAAPLLITLLAAVIFKERVGQQRYIAILVGLVGVLLIVQPGTSGFNIYSLIGLVAMFLVVLRDLLTRGIPSKIPSIIITYATTLATFLFGVIGLVIQSEWVNPPFITYIYLIAAALFLFCGYYFSILTMRIGDIAYTAPFRYTKLLWAIIIGFVIFGEVPDRLGIFGMVIICGTGMYSLYRERVTSVKS